MSIVTYILAFLLILTFISKNYLLQKQTISVAHAAYLQCKMNARETRNALGIEKYEEVAKAHKPKPMPKTKETGRPKPLSCPHPPRTEKEKAIYERERTKRRISRRSTLNLSPLSTTSELRLIATRLILLLYEGTPLFKNNPAYLQELTSLIIDTLKNQKEGSLTGRLKGTRAAHPILYKMLKGTSTYNLEAKRGYPPLSDFLTIDPKDPKAIHFHYASKPLLDALFSRRIRRLIYALEQKKWEAFSHYPYVNKSEAFAILLKEKKSAGFEELEPYLTFSIPNVIQ